MDKKKAPNSKQLIAKLKTLASPVIKHHAVIITVIGFGFAAYAVFGVSQILLMDNQDLDPETQKQTITTNFDQDTINQIKDLKSRQQSTKYDLPSGHINPFK